MSVVNEVSIAEVRASDGGFCPSRSLRVVQIATRITRLPIIESAAICLYNWGILPQHDSEESMMQSGKGREPVVLAVFHKLGGRSALGRDIASTADLARMVILRIPLKSLEHLTRSGSFSDEEISG